MRRCYVTQLKDYTLAELLSEIHNSVPLNLLRHVVLAQQKVAKLEKDRDGWRQLAYNYAATLGTVRGRLITLSRIHVPGAPEHPGRTTPGIPRPDAIPALPTDNTFSGWPKSND